MPGKEVRVVSSDTLQTLGKYLIALVILGGCFFLINSSGPTVDHSPYVGLIGLIAGWIVRDSSGASATSNAIKTVAAATTPPPDPTVVSGSIGG